MTKKNPFKSIEPTESLPEELKDDVLQEIEELIEETQEDSESTNTPDEESSTKKEG